MDVYIIVGTVVYTYIHKGSLVHTCVINHPNIDKIHRVRSNMKCQCGSLRFYKSELKYSDTTLDENGLNWVYSDAVFINMELFRHEEVEKISSFFKTFEWKTKQVPKSQGRMSKMRTSFKPSKESLVWRELGLETPSHLKGYLAPDLFSNTCIDCGRVELSSNLYLTDEKIDHMLHMIEMIEKESNTD